MRKMFQKYYRRIAAAVAVILVASTIVTVPGFAKEVYYFDDSAITNSEIVPDDYCASGSVATEKTGADNISIKLGEKREFPWTFTKKITIASASVASGSGWESMEESGTETEDLAAYIASYVENRGISRRAADDKGEKILPYVSFGDIADDNLDDISSFNLIIHLEDAEIAPGKYNIEVTTSTMLRRDELPSDQYNFTVKESVFPVTINVEESPILTGKYDNVGWYFTSNLKEITLDLAEFLDEDETINNYKIGNLNDFGTYFHAYVDMPKRQLNLVPLTEDCPVVRPLQLELTTDKNRYTGVINCKKYKKMVWGKIPENVNMVLGKTYTYQLKDVPAAYKGLCRSTDNLEVSMSEDKSTLTVRPVAIGDGTVQIIYWEDTHGIYYTDFMDVHVTKAESSGGSGSGGSGGGGGSSSMNHASIGNAYSDPMKGQVSIAQGVITGTGAGYSSWKQEQKQDGTASWKLEYADGTIAVGTIVVKEDGSTYEQPAWEKVNGKWYAFGADGYAKSGFVTDPALGGTFYIDVNTGMKTGWAEIDGKWYYFNPSSDGTQGKMAVSTTVDGYTVDENGVRIQ